MKKIIIDIKAEELKKKLKLRDGKDGKSIKGEKGDPGKDGLDGKDSPQLEEIVNNIPILADKVRDALELLPKEPEDERLDKSAIKGLDDYEEISKLARQGGRQTVVASNKNLQQVTDMGATTTNKITVPAVQFNTTTTPLTNAEGLLQWNATDGTLDLGMSGGDITQQIGQELFMKVRNVSGSLIPNGTPVYVSGRTGNRPNIYPAKSDQESTSRVIGITTQDISSPADGYVTTFGYVRQIKTNYTGTGNWGTTWAEGDKLYVSKTVAGQLTNEEPLPVPHHSDIVATVGIIGAAGIGSILVLNEKHYALQELTDVNGTALTVTGQLPVWTSTGGAGVGYFDFNYNLATGFITVDQTGTQQIGLGELQFGQFKANGYGTYNFYGTGDSYFGNSMKTGMAIAPVYDLGTTAYTSVYPPVQNSTYVKSTSNLGSYVPYIATTPSTSLTGGWSDANSWFGGASTNQRFHVDLGTAEVITRIYYENVHNAGASSVQGVRDFTVWGALDNANGATAFGTLTYGTDTNWVQITTDQSSFDQHVPFDQTDPKYIYLTNTTAYRYYAIKIANNWGGAGNYVGLRRVEFQTSGTGTPTLSLDSDARKLYGIDGTSVMLDYSEIGYASFGNNVLISKYIIGGTAANESMILSGTTSTTKTTSKVLIQPYGGLSAFNTDRPQVLTHIAVPNADAYSTTGMTLGSPTGVVFGIAGDDTGYPYGLYFGRNRNSGASWIQASRTDGTGTAYSLLLQGAGGNVGMGLTSNASAKLHVVDITEQLRLGYDLSNYLSVTMSSTGGIDYDAIGTTPEHRFKDDFYFVGAGTGFPYGSCWGNEIGWSQASAAQNTWYSISDTDMTDGQLNLVTHDGSGKLTVSLAGRYLVNYSWSGDCDSVTKHIQLGIAVSGTVVNDGINHFYVATAAQEFTVSGTTILSLAANATVEVAMRTTDTGTPTLSTDHLNITLVQIGG